MRYQTVFPGLGANGCRVILKLGTGRSLCRRGKVSQEWWCGQKKRRRARSSRLLKSPFGDVRPAWRRAA